MTPFIVPNCTMISGSNDIWRRQSLFDASRGSIGLAWSIFKLRGTPTEDNWPTFNELPDANKVSFHVVPPTDLSAVLPNLPVPRPAGAPDKMRPSPPDFFDLLDRLLVYPPSLRLRPVAALHHPLFSCAILLPSGYPVDSNIQSIDFWEHYRLRDLLITLFSTRRNQIH